MDDRALAAAAATASQIETAVKGHWDLVAQGNDAVEYLAAQAAYRQAVALRRALEHWMGKRALRAHAGV